MAENPTQRTRVTPRRTPDTSQFPTAVADLSGVQRGLDAFFSARRVEEDRERREEENFQLKRSLAEWERIVDSNPEAARRAMETGDYSVFHEVDSQVAQSRAWLVSAPQVVGTSQAMRDSRELESEIARLDPSINGETFADQWLQERRKGMNPFASAAYGGVIEKVIPGLLQRRASAIAKVQNHDLLVRAGQELSDWLPNFSNITDFDNYVRTITGTMAGTGNWSENYLAVREHLKEKLFDAAWGVGGKSPNVIEAAQRLLKERDENGQNLLDKHPELRERAAKAAADRTIAASVEGFYTERWHASLDDFNTRMDAAQVGKGEDGETPAQVWTAAVSRLSEMGGLGHPKFKAFARNYWGTKFTGNKHAGVIEAALSGRPTDTGDLSKAVEAYYFSGTPEQRKLAMAAIADTGNVPPDVRASWESSLTANDPARVLGAAREVHTLAKAGGRNFTELLTDKRSIAMALALENADDVSGVTIAQDLRSKLAEWPGGIDGAFRRTMATGLTSGDQLGLKGIKSWMSDTLDSHDGFREGLARALGVEEGDLGDELENLSNSVVLRVGDLLDIATVMVSENASAGGEGIKSAVVGPVLKMLRDDVEYATNGEGEPLVSLRSTPAIITLPSGKAVRSAPWTKDRVQEWREQQNDLWGSQGWGFTRDPQTRQDGSMLVTVGDNESRAALRLAPSSSLKTELVEGPLSGLVKRKHTVDDATDVEFYVPGDTREDGSQVNPVMPLTTSMYARWNGMGWEVRAVSPRAVTLANEAAMTEEMRARVEEMRALLAKQDAATVPTEVTRALTSDDLSLQAARALMQELQSAPNLSEPAREAALVQARVALSKAASRAADALRGAAESMQPGEDGVEPGVPGLIMQASGASPGETEISAKARGETARQIRDEAVETGVLEPKDAAVALAPGDPAATLENTLNLGMRGGRPVEDLSRPVASPFMDSVVQFLHDRESFVAVATPDPGDPDQLNIGFGFSLNTRNDAREVLEAVGADYDRVLAGKESITMGQAEAIARFGVADLGKWFRRHFKDTPLSKNQLMALMSIAWTSGWEIKGDGRAGPRLITKELTQAIRSGNMALAAELIEYDENVRGPQGDPNRRQLEAAMFRGAAP